MFATIRQAAEVTGLTSSAIRSGVVAGEYPHIMKGTRVYVELDLLCELLRSKAEASLRKDDEQYQRQD